MSTGFGVCLRGNLLGNRVKPIIGFAGRIFPNRTRKTKDGLFSFSTFDQTLWSKPTNTYKNSGSYTARKMVGILPMTRLSLISLTLLRLLMLFISQ